MADSVNIRELALETLLAVGKDGRQSHLLIRDVLDKYFWLSEQEKAFYVRLVNGTIEYRIQLDYILNQFSKTPVKKMKPVIREILRMGVYQLKFMDSVPDSAAVNESVKLAVRKGFSGLRGFVNGVLRSASRGLNEVKYPTREDGEQYLIVRYSMPEYLVHKWIGEYGFETTEKICRGLQEEHPVTVRDRSGILSKQLSENVQAKSSDERVTGIQDGQNEKLRLNMQFTSAPYLPDAFYWTGNGSPAETELFQNGDITIQDVSSMMAVKSLGITDNGLVLDLCAAPGGKSVLAADCMHGTGEVHARDLTEVKTERIRENAERMRLPNIFVELRDATVTDTDMIGKADYVIADVPCSGYGVIGKKPDIRYRASEENQQELIQLQRQILTNAVRYLKPGGRLLFSTCTFGHAENQDTFRWLQQEFGLLPVDLTENIPEELLAEERTADSAADGYVELLPGVCRCDGFFFSVAEKES